jgi:hypothetical protein
VKEYAIDLITLLVTMREDIAYGDAHKILRTKHPGVDEALFATVVDCIRGMFNVQGAVDKKLTIYHKSVYDFLIDSRASEHVVMNDKVYRFHVRIEEGHELFATCLLRLIKRINPYEWSFLVSTPYICKHLVAHMDGAGRRSEGDDLLKQLPWLMKCVEANISLKDIISSIRHRSMGSEAVNKSAHVWKEMLADAIHLSVSSLRVGSVLSPVI